MTSDDLKDRTKNFALRVIRLVENLPNKATGRVLGNQLLRSATSVGANYRSACRSRSKIEFISKIRIVEEESDESIYWLELVRDSNLFKVEKLSDIIQEARELTAIFTAVGKSTKRSLSDSKYKVPLSK